MLAHVGPDRRWFGLALLEPCAKILGRPLGNGEVVGVGLCVPEAGEAEVIGLETQGKLRRPVELVRRRHHVAVTLEHGGRYPAVLPDLVKETLAGVRRIWVPARLHKVEVGGRGVDGDPHAAGGGVIGDVATLGRAAVERCILGQELDLGLSRTVIEGSPVSVDGPLHEADPGVCRQTVCQQGRVIGIVGGLVLTIFAGADGNPGHVGLQG